MGTTGTITGVSRFLREQAKAVTIVGLQPEEGSSIPGIRRWPAEYMPGIFRAQLVDQVLDIHQREAENTMRELAVREGIFCGVSSGGAVAGAIAGGAGKPGCRSGGRDYLRSRRSLSVYRRLSPLVPPACFGRRPDAATGHCQVPSSDAARGRENRRPRHSGQNSGNLVREKKMKILLVDDDVELGTMLSQYLIAEGFETQLVLTGSAGIEGALSGHYTAMILDIMLPDMSGIDVLRQVRQNSRLPVIMLTAKGDNIDRVIGLEMGADDYVPKPCYPRELVARLRAVLRRFEDQAPVPDKKEVLRWGDLSLNPATRITEWQGKAFDLTASEFNLLDLLLRAPDRVVSKDELSEKGLGRPREAYDRSVDVHISNIRQKLAALTADSVNIETVRSIGYRIR